MQFAPKSLDQTEARFCMRINGKYFDLTLFSTGVNAYLNETVPSREIDVVSAMSKFWHEPVLVNLGWCETVWWAFGGQLGMTTPSPRQYITDIGSFVETYQITIERS